MDKDTYCTPNWVLEPVYTFFGQIDLDPCSGEGSIVKSVEKFTKEDDGLTQIWGNGYTEITTVFCNPPYSKPSLGLWSDKCSESPFLNLETLLLVPAYTSAAWFQNNVFSTATSILFYNKRISFIRPDGGKSDSPTFHSVLVYWGRYPAAFKRDFEHQGAVLHLPR